MEKVVYQVRFPSIWDCCESAIVSHIVGKSDRGSILRSWFGGGSFSLFDGRDDDGSTVLDEMLR
jgi:hypothetical protein